MDKNEVRRSRLRQLVDERFSGKVLRLASHLDMKAPQLHRWLSGKQGIHEDSARGIEAKTDLPRGWLDIPLDADRDTGHTAGSAVSPSSDADRDDVGADSDTVSPAMRKVIERLRHADSAGRAPPELLRALEAVLDLSQHSPGAIESAEIFGKPVAAEVKGVPALKRP